MLTCKVNGLHTFEHMSAHWVIKVYVFVKFYMYITNRVFELLRETRKTHLGVLLFTNSCKHVRDGVSTWAKFDGHIYYEYLVMQKYLPFIMYYGSALLLFTCKVHCLQTF